MVENRSRKGLGNLEIRPRATPRPAKTVTLEAGHRSNWSLGRGMSNFDVSRPFSGPNFRQENSTKSANSDMGCPYGGAQPGARRGHQQGLPRPRAQCTKTLARSWAKRRGAKLIVCLGGASPPKAVILHLLCVLPTILQEFSYTGPLVLAGLASALGARPAALPQKGVRRR